MTDNFTVPNLPRKAGALGAYLGVTHLPLLISRFLYEQDNLGLEGPLDAVPIEDCPAFKGRVRVFPSASAVYYAPSDKSGTRGMFRERIRAVQSWRGGPARRDCVFIDHDPSVEGFQGLLVARVHSFLLLKDKKFTYPCALVMWFSTVGTSPCPQTGMWMVEPDFDSTGNRAMSIIHIDSILRGAHIMGNAGNSRIPRHLTCDDSLDAFSSFFVNKYIDHHAYEIAF